jgi:ABC-type uncharacterized transport system fused permease/ATPase subunit
MVTKITRLHSYDFHNYMSHTWMVKWRGFSQLCHLDGEMKRILFIVQVIASDVHDSMMQHQSLKILIDTNISTYITFILQLFNNFGMTFQLNHLIFYYYLIRINLRVN